MKQGNTFKENIEFLIMMYEKELSRAEADKRTEEEKEMIDCYLIELRTIIQLSK